MRALEIVFAVIGFPIRLVFRAVAAFEDWIGDKEWIA